VSGARTTTGRLFAALVLQPVPYASPEGRVRIVRDQATGECFALKTVDRGEGATRSELAAAWSSYETAAAIELPGVVRVLDRRSRRRVWGGRGRVEVLMELVPGLDLDRMIQRARPDLATAVAAALGVADALHAMHRKGVYHGDLAPSHAMLRPDGHVTLVSLDGAWRRGSVPSPRRGASPFRAPEMAPARVSTATDFRADLFGLAALACILATGSTVVPDARETGDALPGTLRAVLERCLAPDPDRRPAGLFEVRPALQAVLRHRGIEEGGQARLAEWSSVVMRTL
jgi:serine/threonine-protein kinase